MRTPGDKPSRERTEPAVEPASEDAGHVRTCPAAPAAGSYPRSVQRPFDTLRQAKVLAEQRRQE
ncbi:MAG: hypothetical protein IMZ44_13505 [Planctomycetes bacterium]|nr:hypothetical protein [Planctomycetota bacterium]